VQAQSARHGEHTGAFFAQLTAMDKAGGKKMVRRTRPEDADGRPVFTGLRPSE
jgi:hypothetical protein